MLIPHKNPGVASVSPSILHPPPSYYIRRYYMYAYSTPTPPSAPPDRTRAQRYTCCLTCANLYLPFPLAGRWEWKRVCGRGGGRKYGTGSQRNDSNDRVWVSSVVPDIDHTSSGRTKRGRVRIPYMTYVTNSTQSFKPPSPMEMDHGL